MVDDGLLSYPYSTRELVNLVRHLEAFPKDSLVQTVENVFAFDNYDTGLREQVTQAFHRHGIPVGIVRDRFQVPPVPSFSLPAPPFLRVVLGLRRRAVGLRWTLPSGYRRQCRLVSWSLRANIMSVLRRSLMPRRRTHRYM